MVAFTIFGFSIYWYGIFYALAFIIGYLGLSWIGKKNIFFSFPKIQKLLTQDLEDLIFSIALGVVLGWRLGHILIYGNGYYFQNWEAIFKVWEGGMSFIGGIFGVLISVFIFFQIKGLKKREFFVIFDLILIFVPLGILLGRLWNFLNQELYGIPVDHLPSWLSTLFSTLGATYIYPKVDQFLRVNTNMLAMIFEWALLFWVQILTFFWQIKKRYWKVWLLATNFLLFYSLVRFWLEYLRADSQWEWIGILTKSQRFFLIFIIIALVLKLKVTPLLNSQKWA